MSIFPSGIYKVLPRQTVQQGKKKNQILSFHNRTTGCALQP